MSTTSLKRAFDKQPKWYCKLGVLLCIMALAFSLFGHIESLEVRPLNGKSMVIELLHAQGAGHSDAKAIAHHCMHQSQCTAQAVLPSDPFSDDVGATQTKLAADLLATSRAISPRHHPPKTSSLT